MSKREQDAVQAITGALTTSAKVEAAISFVDIADESLGRCDEAGLASFEGVLSRLLALVAHTSLGVRIAAATALGLTATAVLRAATQGAASEAPALRVLLLSTTVDHDTFSTPSPGPNFVPLLFAQFDMSRVLVRGTALVASGDDRSTSTSGGAAPHVSSLNDAQRALLQRSEALRIIGMEASSAQETAEGAWDAATGLRVTSGLGAMIDQSDLVGAGAGGAVLLHEGGDMPANDAVGTTRDQAGTGATAGASSSSSSEGRYDPPIPASIAPFVACFRASVWASLAASLLHPAWARRQGAALALGEILRACEPRGLTPPPPEPAAQSSPGEGLGQPALQDVALRCLALLALDRFGDYGGQGAGTLGCAPVREAAAHALSLACGLLPPSGQEFVLASLLTLAQHGTSGGDGSASRPPEWLVAVRHGAFLGLRAVCSAVISSSGVSPAPDSRVLPVCLQALQLSGGAYAGLILAARKARVVPDARGAAANIATAAPPSGAVLALGATEDVIACACDVVRGLVPALAAAEAMAGLTAALDCLASLLDSAECPASDLAGSLVALVAAALSAAGDAGQDLLPRIAAACARLGRHPAAGVRLQACETMGVTIRAATCEAVPAEQLTWWAREGIPACIRSLWRTLLLDVSREGVRAAQAPAFSGTQPIVPPAPSLVDVASATSDPYVSQLRDAGWISGVARDDAAAQADPAAAVERVCLRGIEACASLLRSLTDRELAPPASQLASWPWLRAACDALATPDGEIPFGPAVEEPVLSTLAPYAAVSGGSGTVALSPAHAAPAQFPSAPVPLGGVAKPPPKRKRGKGRAASTATAKKRAVVAPSSEPMIGEEDLSDFSDWEDGTDDAAVSSGRNDAAPAPSDAPEQANGWTSAVGRPASPAESALQRFHGLTFHKRQLAAAALAIVLRCLDSVATPSVSLARSLLDPSQASVSGCYYRSLTWALVCTSYVRQESGLSSHAAPPASSPRLASVCEVVVGQAGALTAQWTLAPLTAATVGQEVPAVAAPLVRRVWSAVVDAHAAVTAAIAAASRAGADAQPATKRAKKQTTPATPAAGSIRSPAAEAAASWGVRAAGSGCFPGIDSPDGTALPPSLRWGVFHWAGVLLGPVATAAHAQIATADSALATRPGADATRRPSPALSELRALQEDADGYLGTLRSELATAQALWASLQSRLTGSFAAALASVVVTVEGTATAAVTVLPPQLTAGVKLAPLFHGLLASAGAADSDPWERSPAACAVAWLLRYLNGESVGGPTRPLSRPHNEQAHTALASSVLSMLAGPQADAAAVGAAVALHVLLADASGTRAPGSLVGAFLAACETSLPSGERSRDPTATTALDPSAALRCLAALLSAGALFTGVARSRIMELSAALLSATLSFKPAGPLSSAGAYLLNDSTVPSSLTSASDAQSICAPLGSAEALVQAALTHDVALWCHLMHTCILPLARPLQPIATISTALRLISTCLTDVTRVVRICNSSQPSDLLRLESVVARIAPVLFTASLPLMSHSHEPLRRDAAAAFRLVVRLLPLQQQQRTAPKSSESDPLLSRLSPALLRDIERSRDTVRVFTAGAAASLRRLPVSIATAVMGGEESAAAADVAPAGTGSDGALSLPPGVSLPPGISLRPYQAAGVAWLDFLRRVHLHGVLADDMGLGKSLQTLCALALAAYDRAADGEDGACARSTAASDVGVATARPSVSVIVCPSSLVHHWTGEVRRFFGHATLPHAGSSSGGVPLFDCVVWAGTPVEREAALGSVAAHVQEAAGASSGAVVTSAPSEAAPSAPPPSPACAHLLVVTSYTVVRKEAAALLAALGAPARLLYCVLDEGHVVHNPASATSQAVRLLGAAASHRLVLTGTPIQNAVGDLWALFEFLCPGYLGSHAQFRKAVAAPLERAKSPTATDGDVAAARVALRSLHRSILPFVLRRMKGHVLSELPPKVVTDVLLDLTPVQAALYGALARGSSLREATWRGVRLREVLPLDDGTAAGSADVTAEGAAAVGGASGLSGSATTSAAPPNSVLAALTHLQAVCDHPGLLSAEVLVECASTLAADPACNPALASVLQRIARGAGVGKGRLAPADSCKLLELVRLLRECRVIPSAPDADDEEAWGDGASGAGVAGPRTAESRKRGTRNKAGSSQLDPSSDETLASLAPPRKALVFSRFPVMLQAAEEALTGPSLLGCDRLPCGAVVRMDGSTPPASRAAIAATFNASASQRVLLLTTGVGGLGLNLTGADVVVFLDCSWNPAVDAQAADRAHRIGQTRCVQVYRLLARGTLEERVLSLQRWKTDVVAGSVVGQPANSDLTAMSEASLGDLLGGAVPDRVMAGSFPAGSDAGASAWGPRSEAASAGLDAASHSDEDNPNVDSMELAAFIGLINRKTG